MNIKPCETLISGVKKFVVGDNTNNGGLNNTLDVPLLESAQNNMDADYPEYHQLLFLARSSTLTKLILTNDRDPHSVWVYGEEVQATLKLGYNATERQTVYGYTVVNTVDGQSLNSQSPEYHSRSGLMEIYIMTVEKGKPVPTAEIVATMAHEMYVHNYLYQTGQRWNHILGESKGSEFEKGVQKIEDRAKTAFSKH